MPNKCYIYAYRDKFSSPIPIFLSASENCRKTKVYVEEHKDNQDNMANYIDSEKWKLCRPRSSMKFV